MSEPSVLINPTPIQVAARVEQQPIVMQPANRSLIVIPEGYKDMSDPMSYLGTGPSAIWHATPVELDLTDTTFGAWSASTTASSIWSDATIIKSIAITPNDHDYVLEWKVAVDMAYVDGATLKVCPATWCGLIYYDIFRYSSNLTNLKAKTLNSTSTVALRTLGMIEYYNSNGVLTYSVTSYGVYGVAVAPTFTSATSATPTLNIKLPSLSARCNTTYFAVARKPEVDLENTHIKIDGTLYQFDADTIFERRARKELMDFIQPHLI